MRKELEGLMFGDGLQRVRLEVAPVLEVEHEALTHCRRRWSDKVRTPAGGCQPADLPTRVSVPRVKVFEPLRDPEVSGCVLGDRSRVVKNPGPCGSGKAACRQQLNYPERTQGPTPPLSLGPTAIRPQGYAQE